MYRVLIYARYSDKNQNPRSIDQQVDNIRREIERQKLPWKVIGIYKDEGVSGRKFRERTGLRKMITDLKSGNVTAELVLVDTFERLSRADDQQSIRTKLSRLGLMVLTADSQFTDPTSSAGSALTFIESLRAQDAGKVKAHDVLRGKLDAVRQRHWPGGPIPFGYMLKTIFKVVSGVEMVDYRILVINPATGWIVVLIFQLADQGLGAAAIARRLKRDERIYNEFASIGAPLIRSILSNSIYFGLYKWNKRCSGIQNDVRVLQCNPESEWEKVEGFCEPIVSEEIWIRVNGIRVARGVRLNELRAQKVGVPDNGIPNVRGVALKYMLSGLVRCALCNRAMVASSHAHVLKTGETKRYVNYFCTASRDGRCFNNCSIREEWLREVVIDLMKKRVFYNGEEDVSASNMSVKTENQLLANTAFQELVEQVQREYDKLMDSSPDQDASLEIRRQDCQTKRDSLLLSLGKSTLDSAVRELVEQQLAAVIGELRQVEADLTVSSARLDRFSRIVTAEQVADKLTHLSSILASGNVPAINLQLAHHIQSITADENGVVRIRTCKLGNLAEISDMFKNEISAGACELAPAIEGIQAGSPLRLRRRDTQTAYDEDEDADAANEFATDPKRFSGLGPEWFWIDEFKMPKREKWAATNAMQVAQSRLDNPCSLEKLAARFDKTKPTILDALRIAKQNGLDAFIDTRRTRPNWARDNCQVVKLFLSNAGTSLSQAAVHFGKSEKWISQALKFADEAIQRSVPLFPDNPADMGSQSDATDSTEPGDAA
jgi:DNA invertase Pin-like site-specific DNA recombinase